MQVAYQNDAGDIKALPQLNGGTKTSHHSTSQGLNVHFIKEVNRDGAKTADAYLNGEVWEFKVPEAYRGKTVKNQMKKALGKGTGRLLISCTENMADAAEVAGGVESLFERGEFMGIAEVMVMSADGRITRMIRQ